MVYMVYLNSFLHIPRFIHRRVAKGEKLKNYFKTYYCSNEYPIQTLTIMFIIF